MASDSQASSLRGKVVSSLKSSVGKFDTLAVVGGKKREEKWQRPSQKYGQLTRKKSLWRKVRNMDGSEWLSVNMSHQSFKEYRNSVQDFAIA